VKIVISQPMFFPWIGLFEQIRLADVYVHYDDVQFSKGSFVNRVQIKTPSGIKWLTVPLANIRLGQLIKDITFDTKSDWGRKHISLLSQIYASSPFKTDMLDLVSTVYNKPADSLMETVVAGIEEVCSYFNIANQRKSIYSSDLGIGGKSSQRVLDIVKHLSGTHYITGHGARNYLDHDLFEYHGIRVEYMDYQKIPYAQLHGTFTPYVSILDLIANTGINGRSVIVSETVNWKDFTK